MRRPYAQNDTNWAQTAFVSALQAAFLILVIVAGRLVPHPPNVAPVAAASLMAGIYGPRRWAALVPLAGLLITDAYLGFYAAPVMCSVYGSFFISFLIGRLCRGRATAVHMVSASLASSLVFFLLTNAAVWKFSSLYPSGIGGLYESYIMAIPFFRNTVLGDLMYVMALSGIFRCAMVLARRTNSPARGCATRTVVLRSE